MQLPEIISAMSVANLEAAIPAVALGIALTLAVSIVMKLTGPFNAATRCAVWAATLAMLPVIQVLLLASHTKVTEPAAKPSIAITAISNAPVHSEAAAPATAMPVASYAPHNRWLNISLPREMPLVVLVAYMGIAGILLLRLLGSYASVCLLRRRSRKAPADVHARVRHWLARCPTERTFEFRLSDTVRSPIAIGFLRPTIVMPSAFVLELSQEEFDDLGVHELAHIRRYDDWSNLIQRIVQAFLFFHPAAYWAGSKLNFEREVACDDWVVSTSGPKSYANCLSKIVELRRWHRGAALVSGAFFGKRQILRRVEIVLDKTRNAATGVSALTVVAIVIALIGITMQVAQLPAFVTFTRDAGDAHMNARWKDENRDLRVGMSGQIKLNPDERSIASMSPWGYLDIVESKGWSSRRLEIRPSASGGVEEKYFVDGRRKPIDAAGQAWATAMYPFLVRELGIDAEGRVGRILARSGVAGVLDEVNLIRSDNIKRQYLTRLMEEENLTPDELYRVAICARKFSSDHEKAEFLLANAHRFATDILRRGYFQAVDSIHSDHDRRRVLKGVLDADGRSPETASLVGKSAKSMNSDHDKAEVLLAIPAASGETGCALLKAAQSIHSDNDKTRVLREAGYPESPQCREVFFAVVNVIHSDNDRSAVLRDMLKRPGLGAATYQSVAAAAKAIGSDNDKANVLTLLSGSYTDAPFFEALKTVRSDHDRKRVLKNLIGQETLKPVLLQVIDTASGISSDGDKAEILIAAARASSDAEVRSAVQRACSKLRSDGDYRRVASVLFGGNLN